MQKTRIWFQHTQEPVQNCPGLGDLAPSSGLLGHLYSCVLMRTHTHRHTHTHTQTHTHTHTHTHTTLPSGCVENSFLLHVPERIFDSSTSLFHRVGLSTFRTLPQAHKGLPNHRAKSVSSRTSHQASFPSLSPCLWFRSTSSLISEMRLWRRLEVTDGYAWQFGGRA